MYRRPPYARGCFAYVQLHSGNHPNPVDKLGDDCSGTCPAVPALEWEHPSPEGAAHLLVFGDSTAGSCVHPLLRFV